MREPSGNPSTFVFPRSSAGPAADVLMPARLGRAPCRGWSWQNCTTRRRGKRREQEEVVARSERRAAEREAAQAEQARRAAAERAAEIARRQERQRLDRGQDFGPSR